MKGQGRARLGQSAQWGTGQQPAPGARGPEAGSTEGQAPPMFTGTSTGCPHSTPERLPSSPGGGAAGNKDPRRGSAGPKAELGLCCFSIKHGGSEATRVLCCPQETQHGQPTQQTNLFGSVCSQQETRDGREGVCVQAFSEITPPASFLKSFPSVIAGPGTPRLCCPRAMAKMWSLLPRGGGFAQPN